MSKTIDYELEDGNEIATAVRGSRVSQLFVEFLQQGGPKPHVVLRLNIDPPVYAGKETWKGCRLGMDLIGDYNGVFHITPLPYDTTSHAAHAAFEFKVKANWTVNNFISTICQPDTNLRDFSFVGGFMQPGSRIEYFDGCRDFITQFFIILHRWGAVGWHIHNIDRGSFNGRNLNFERGRTGFHEIIGYNYKDNKNKTSTVVQDLPIARGTFLSPDFSRIVTYRPDAKHSYQLPYDPRDLQSGDDGFATLTSQSAGTSQQTYPTQWQWSDEYKQYWRNTSEGQTEWSPWLQETSTNNTTSQGSASMYNPQPTEPGQGSGYVNNAQQFPTEDTMSLTQQTYPTEWQWSDEYGQYYRQTSEGVYEYAPGTAKGKQRA